MTRGYNRRQIGVTAEMIAAFAPTIFALSNNHQVRRGDPVRTLDFDAIDRQRPDLGMADADIAARIGLTRDQVTYIRTIAERRQFHTGHFNRLLDLGGGRRFRAERFVTHDDRPTFSDAALDLRAALRFPADRVQAYVAAGWWADDTLHGRLQRHAAERPDAPAIIHQGVHGQRVLTWAETAAQADRIARALFAIGIRRGDVVALQLPNLPEFLLAYLAVTSLGAVLSTIHMPYRQTEMATLLRHSRARAIICLSQAKDWSPAAAALALKAQLPDLDYVIALGPLNDEQANDAVLPPDAILSLDAMLASDAGDAGEAPSEAPHQDAPHQDTSRQDALAATAPADQRTRPVASDPFLLLFTSGTTSAPKAVPLSYHTMLSNARLGAPEHGITADDRILSAAPFSHLFGLYSVHIAMATGAAMVLLPAFSPPDMAATIAQARPTALWTAPAHIAACRALNLFDSHDLSSLALVIMSGSACPPELVRWLDQRLPACRVTQLWGMTETQGALYSRPGDAIDIAATTAGRPSPGTAVRIMPAPHTGPDDGPDEGSCDGLAAPCPAGEEGELQVRGALLFPGYYGNDAANEDAFTADGWFKTGDLATMDAAGNVAITGRIKDVINRGGVKFNPRDIEDLLDAHPDILQSAIVPMPDPVLGERACAFITQPPDASPVTLAALCDWLLARNIAKNKLPERLVVTDAMPMTPTRKIIKAQLTIPPG